MINNFQKVAWCVFQMLITKLLSYVSGDSCMENIGKHAGNFQNNTG